MAGLTGACAGPAPSAILVASATSSATPVASTTSSATPSATAGPTAVTSPSAAACGVQEHAWRLPSDRLVDVRISEAAGVDVVTFVFGDPSSPAPPQGPSNGAIRAVEPPFTAAASGVDLEVPGEHHVEITFTGMTLVDPSGEPTYDGQTSFRDDRPALRSMEQSDASEGQWAWIIGYDGPGCVTLASGPGTVSVVIEHGPG